MSSPNLTPPYPGMVLSGFDQWNNPKWENQGFRPVNASDLMARETLIDRAIDLTATKIIGDFLTQVFTSLTEEERSSLKARALERISEIIIKSSINDCETAAQKIVKQAFQEYKLPSQLEEKANEILKKQVQSQIDVWEEMLQRDLSNKVFQWVKSAVETTIQESLRQQMKAATEATLANMEIVLHGVLPQQIKTCPKPASQ